MAGLADAIQLHGALGGGRAGRLHRDGEHVRRRSRVPDADAISVICGLVGRVLTVSEDDAAEAMRVLFATTHDVAEPAGALALAGLLAESQPAAAA